MIANSFKNKCALNRYKYKNRAVNLNPFKPNSISHSYQMDQSIPFLRVVGGISVTDSGYPDQTPHSVASDLGLHCLYMHHKKETRLIWIKKKYCIHAAMIYIDDTQRLLK